jgi:CHASE2 domain-containing sensor protein
LRGRTVLIGGEFADRDVHLTPLSVADDARMHGVFIHAQILAQLRDGRSIHLFSIWQELLAVALVAGAGFAAALRWRLRSYEWLVSAGALAIAIVTGLILFAASGFALPSATLILAWPAGLIAGNRCEKALREHGSPFPRFMRRQAETG